MANIASGATNHGRRALLMRFLLGTVQARQLSYLFAG
jgi:hypothetical protein